jgi:hypothetical protein
MSLHFLCVTNTQTKREFSIPLTTNSFILKTHFRRVYVIDYMSFYFSLSFGYRFSPLECKTGRRNVCIYAAKETHPHGLHKTRECISKLHATSQQLSAKTKKKLHEET